MSAYEGSKMQERNEDNRSIITQGPITSSTPVKKKDPMLLIQPINLTRDIFAATIQYPDNITLDGVRALAKALEIIAMSIGEDVTVSVQNNLRKEDKSSKMFERLAESANK